MDVGEKRNFGDSQTPDKEYYQNPSHILTESIQDYNQIGEQAQYPRVMQDLMAGYDAIPWLEGESFSISNEAFPSSADFGCLSSPSLSLPHSFPVHPQQVLSNNPVNSYPSFACSSSSPSSIWSTLQVPPCVPRSLPRNSSEMTMQSQVLDLNPLAGMQLGLNSSEQLPNDALMMDQLGKHTIQPSKFDLSSECTIQPSIFARMNNSSGIEGKGKESDDVAKFIHEWLERNKDVISPEDLRSIHLKNSTIECMERHLGPGPCGRLQLVQLILAWVQNHHLKNKKHRLQDESNVISWGSPLLLSNQDCSTNSGIITSQSFKTGSQPTQYCATPISPLCNQELNMASMLLTSREAQEKRMARKRRMASLKQSRALGQSGTKLQDGSIAQGNIDTDNWDSWSSLAVNSQSLLSGGSSSNSATVWQQDLNFHGKNLKFILQKVLKPSDVGSSGRIVLPKKAAEIHLPVLDSKDGITIPMEDIRTSDVWEMRYRFWPNNKSRMYVLENTGDFIRSNELEAGDLIQIYSDLQFGKYMIRGVKARKP